jgi:hypothetical protein
VGHLSALFQRRPRAVALLATSILLTAALVAPAVWSVDGTVANAIEVDGNLYPGGGNNLKLCPTLNGGFDWVANCDATVANPKLVADAGVVTGKAGATGNWNGVRIVDGVTSGEKDIFLTGGKENDTSTWNVGAGTVGSSKYDATQAYLANNSTNLFFGMERRGNNGTTAFDFEFNQAAPPTGENYIPTRTPGDVLLTFELNGSGNTGSATPYYFTWNGSKYDPKPIPSSVVAAINNRPTPSAPWGHVSGQGEWDGTDLDRFELGEASVPLSILPGVDACGGTAYVQLRTRSSATETSDLKDTTKIFKYEFPGITVSATKQSADATSESVTLAASASGASGLSYEWSKSANNSTYSVIPNATSSTLTYSSFAADDLTPDSTGSFQFTGDTYVGKVYVMYFKVRAYKAGSPGCQQTSTAVTVKKLVAVDP